MQPGSLRFQPSTTVSPRRAIMNRLVSTEVSVVPRNARAWLGRVEHGSSAPVNNNGYASEDFTGIQDDDEPVGGQHSMGNGIQIAIVRPRNFRDAATIGEYYRQDIPVIINLEDMEHAEAGRIVDFVSGLVLGLCGDIERVSRRTFLVVPVGAALLTTHNSLTEEGFFNQALRSVRRQSGLSRKAGRCFRAGLGSRGMTAPWRGEPASAVAATRCGEMREIYQIDSFEPTQAGNVGSAACAS